MSVEDVKTVDAISIDVDGNIVLTISDHLEWNDEHLLLLQEKLNNYLSFIESGEISESYPPAKDSKIKINVVYKYEPTIEGVLFLSKCSSIISKAGIGFSYELGI